MDKLKQWLQTAGEPGQDGQPRKMTQEEFAALIGRTQAYVSYLLNGKIKPDGQLVTQIARITGGQVTFDDWGFDQVAPSGVCDVA